MTPPDDTQRTIGGLAGKAVGKVKEALGQATDSHERKRAGRLQQAQSEAGLEAEEASRAAREREAHEAERRADALDPAQDDS